MLKSLHNAGGSTRKACAWLRRDCGREGQPHYCFCAWAVSFFFFVFMQQIYHCRSLFFRLVGNVFGLCVRAGFGVQNCQPALNLIRSTKLQVCTSARLTQNPCYLLVFCQMLCPPETFIICPVVHDAFSLTRKLTVSAMSFGKPNLFIGKISNTCFSNSSFIQPV